MPNNIVEIPTPELIENVPITDFKMQITFGSFFKGLHTDKLFNEWVDNVNAASQIYFDITRTTVKTMDDGRGMTLDTFKTDFIGIKDKQGLEAGSTGVFGVGGSKGIPFHIGRPLEVAFMNPNRDSYYRGVYVYQAGDKVLLRDNELGGSKQFPLNGVDKLSVDVYSMTKEEYLEKFTREDGFVPSFVFTVEKLGAYRGKKKLKVNPVKRQMSIKMLEMRNPPMVTVTNEEKNGKVSVYPITSAYHQKVFEMKDGTLKVAPTSLSFLDKEDRSFWIQDNSCRAEMDLKCYKKSHMKTDGNRIYIKKIDDMRAGEVNLKSYNAVGKAEGDFYPIGLICTPDGRILHQWKINPEWRKGIGHLMNFMVFVFYMKDWNQQVPFCGIKHAALAEESYEDLHEQIKDFMQEPAQVKRFRHDEKKEEDAQTEELRKVLVYGETAEATMSRSMLSEIADCKPKELKGKKSLIKCQLSEVRDYDMKIELETPLILENKLEAIGQKELDQAISMSYYLDYKHHMVLLCDEITPHIRDNGVATAEKRMNDDRLGKAVSFTIMTKIALETGVRGDTDFIELYRHEDYV